MRFSKNQILLTFLLAFLSSCEVPVMIEVPSSQTQLVIDAFISNKVGGSRVRLFFTSSYLDTTVTWVGDASIRVLDEVNNLSFTFSHRGEGLYLPVTEDLAFTPGVTYELILVLGDEEYRAVNRLPSRILHDSLTYIQSDLSYFVTLHYQEPANTSNYYRWMIFSDDSLTNAGNFDIFDDTGFDGQYTDYQQFFRIPSGSRPPERIVFDLLHLNRETFDYYLGINELTQNGTPTVSVPENPITNFEDGVLGFFAAVAVTSDTVEVVAVEE